MFAFPLWARISTAVMVVLLMSFSSSPFGEIWVPIKNWLQGKKTPPTRRPKPIIWVGLSVLLIIGASAEAIAVSPPPAENLQTPAFDLSSFVYDETMSDDSQVSPGQPFDKKWRLYNGGETEWGSGYEARRDNKIGIPVTNFGPDGFTVPNTLPGHDGILTARMIAPLTPGCYRNRYRMYHGDTPFGETFDVQIVVVSKQVHNYALWVDHLNIRDGTNFPVNTPFRKGWVVHNCGMNAWVNYKAVRVGGDLPGPAVIPIKPTSGQQDVAIWGDFRAPSMVESASTATYQLEDAQGNPIANGMLEVTIKSF